VSHYLSFTRLNHHHIGLLARCFLRYLEELPTVEKVGIVQGWQVLLFGNDAYYRLIHAAKIQNK
jgi:hypothetical protein